MTHLQCCQSLCKDQRFWKACKANNKIIITKEKRKKEKKKRTILNSKSLLILNALLFYLIKKVKREREAEALNYKYTTKHLLEAVLLVNSPPDPVSGVTSVSCEPLGIQQQIHIFTVL